MAKSRSTAKLVVTSVILSLVVIAVFALVFLNYIVPAYQISDAQIYSVLIKLFPILVGLVLIQIGVMVGKRHEDDFRDQVDKLPPNSYSKNLDAVKDDPSHVAPVGAAAQPQAERIVEKPVEVIKEVPVEVIKEVVKEVPVEKEVIKQVPIEREIIRAVPIEVIKEVVKEVPFEVIKEVPVEREVIKEVPIIREVIREVPIEVVKNVEVPVKEEVVAEDVMLSFKDAVESENLSAKENGYDLTLAYVKKSAIEEDRLNAIFGENAIIFEDGDAYALLFPFASKAETDSIFRDKEAEDGNLIYSTATSVKGSTATDSLIGEARALL